MLIIWIPLIKNFENLGLSNMNFYPYGSSTGISFNANGKLGGCYERTSSLPNAYRSSSTINLSGDITMCCWTYVSDCPSGDTANGIISNHSHKDNTGVGITVKQISASDYRISCSTGTGSNRTFCTYYGTTNIKNKWAHLALTYNKTLKELKLYVNGNCEYTLSNYVNASKEDYIDIFNWSTSNIHSSSFRAICKLSDVRIYKDSCLSPKEVHEIAKGLVLHYPLNDLYVLSTVYDCSGYCNNGTVTGSLQVVDDSPRYKKSTKITTSNTIKTTVPVLNNIYSFSWWYNKVNFADGDMMWGYANGNRINPLHYLCFNIGDGISSPWYIPGTTTKITAPSGNTWHHFVITGDGSTSTLYVDGNRYGTCINFKSITGSILHINGWSSGGDYRTNGKISDFRIYSTALSEDDIKELYNTSAIINNNNTLEVYEFSESNTYSINKSGVLEGAEFIEQDGDVLINNTEQVFATEFTEI